MPAFFQGFLDDWAKRKEIGNEVEKEQYFEGFLELLKDEILTAKKTHHLYVITSEHLHSRVRKQEEIARLYKYLVGVFDEVEVVCYFRDQFDVAISYFSTALQNNSSTSVEAFVEQAKPENYYYNYLQIADNWAGVFGKENCNFRIYDRSKFTNNDIRFDFLSVMGCNIDSTFLNMDRTLGNESLYLFQSAAFKAINRNVPYWASDKPGINKEYALAKQNILNIESFKVGKISSDKSELIRSRFAAINSMFFKKYFKVENEFPISSSEANGSMACDDAMNAVEDALEFGLKMNLNITPSLSEEQINSLRDIALRIYDVGASTRKDALALMKIALNHRPQGALIKNKVEQWSAILNSSDNE